VEICGDGYLSSSAKGDCDDGNTQGGDGCSSACKVENYYSCSKNSQSTSVCTYQGIPLDLSLSHIDRNAAANQGTFVFQLSPALLMLNAMDFLSHVVLDCSSKQKVVGADYNFGVLTLTVDYC
jgi:cysteine-rich repeat protein